MIEVVDRITNIGCEPSTAMLLYHVNLGWPLLSEKSRLADNVTGVKGVTDRADAHLAQRCKMMPPTPGFQEHTYSMEPKAGADGLCRAALINPDLDGGTALSVTWPKATMPFMAEWKMMGQGTYVLGIEPCNCPFPPRANLRERGLMPTLRPGQSFEAGMVIRVHRGADEIEEIEQTIRER